MRHVHKTGHTTAWLLLLLPLDLAASPAKNQDIPGQGGGHHRPAFPIRSFSEKFKVKGSKSRARAGMNFS
jgi:hypothetical protein